MPSTESGNEYIVLITYTFSCHAAMYAISGSTYSVESTADILLYKYLPRWSVPEKLLSDKGPHIFSDMVSSLLGSHRIFTYPYPPSNQ